MRDHPVSPQPVQLDAQLPSPDAVTARIRRSRTRARLAAARPPPGADTPRPLGGTPEHLAQVHADRGSLD